MLTGNYVVACEPLTKHMYVIVNWICYQRDCIRQSLISFEDREMSLFDMLFSSVLDS